MKGKVKYQFTSTIWKHDAPGGWHFTSLPKSTSRDIRTLFGWQEEGWGRMKVKAQIEDVNWETAIWFDTKLDTYILPLKAEIRKKCKLDIDTITQIYIYI
ncbi:MAG: hypothetical protein BM564_01295 [Bacteroidetes bacterium MedPE-SWsnd-G2]|nr:MAG: hypothetical protein BM564_01295 [Bacteroidetes bacterium MedPE-SWsnd-G2]